MPCSSQHMFPNDQERYNRKTALLYMCVRIYQRLPIEEALVEAAHRSFCQDDFTPDLCALLKVMTIMDRDRMLTHLEPLGLGDWWTEHCKWDEEREGAR